MSFISCYTPCLGMKIQFLNKPSILSNEQSSVHHDEEKEVVDKKKESQAIPMNNQSYRIL